MVHWLFFFSSPYRVYLYFLSFPCPIALGNSEEGSAAFSLAPLDRQGLQPPSGSVRGWLVSKWVCTFAVCAFHSVTVEIYRLVGVEWGRKERQRKAIWQRGAPCSSQISFQPLLSHVICFTALQFWIEKVEFMVMVDL